MKVIIELDVDGAAWNEANETVQMNSHGAFELKDSIEDVFSDLITDARTPTKVLSIKVV